MKLERITLPENKPKDLRVARDVNLSPPDDCIVGWTIIIRGPSVVLISPKGKGHEFARSVCVLTWDSSNPTDYDKLTNYTSEPLSRTPVQLSDAELEAATAPAAKAGAK